MRAIQPKEILIAAASEFKRMAALATTEVKDGAILAGRNGIEEEVDLALGDIGILNHITIGAQVVGIKDLTPPICFYITLQILHGS